MIADANITLARDPATTSGHAWSGASVSADSARQASTRIRRAAWVFAITWAVVIVLNDFVFAGPAKGVPGFAWATRQTALTIVGLVASLGMVWLSRRLQDTPELLFDVALFHGVLTALLVALVTEYYPRTEPQAISWVCIVILALPTIAPASPRRTFAAALVAAATVPIALAIARYTNPAYDPRLVVMVYLILPPFLCAALAVIPAMVINRLNTQLKHARELGSYTLEEKIGSGGMGEVYRARHRLLARPAAVKLISHSVMQAAGPSSQVAIARFRREAEAAASLKSPHTIQLYDFGVADDGTFYYVMELLDGIDLQELVTRHGPLPSERVCHLLMQACDSLGEAHAIGMVHRDIKPSNILACRMGLHVDFVKVLDFGLVKKAVEMEEDATQLTLAGMVSGTPAFMSPESATGIHSVTPRSDVYALGCVGYWLLTGKNVFNAKNATMMMMQHIQNAPMPPSAHAPQPVPKRLEDIVMRCLSKNPADRPADATELLSLLAKPSPAWTHSDAHLWWQSHRPAERQVT